MEYAKKILFKEKVKRFLSESLAGSETLALLEATLPESVKNYAFSNSTRRVIPRSALHYRLPKA